MWLPANENKYSIVYSVHLYAGIMGIRVRNIYKYVLFFPVQFKYTHIQHLLHM